MVGIFRNRTKTEVKKKNFQPGFSGKRKWKELIPIRQRAGRIPENLAEQNMLANEKI